MNHSAVVWPADQEISVFLPFHDLYYISESNLSSLLKRDHLLTKPGMGGASGSTIGS